MIFEINVSRIDRLVMGDYETNTTKKMYYITILNILYLRVRVLNIDLNQYL